MTTVAFDDANSTNRDILFRQYDLGELAAGQEFFSDEAGPMYMAANCRVMNELLNNNMYFTLGLRIIGDDSGPLIVRATLLPLTVVSSMAEVGTLMGRYEMLAVPPVNYTSVVRDHPVLEIGMGGDPAAGRHHDSSMSLGDDSASDLSGDDNPNAFNPWFEFTDLNLIYVGHPAMRRWGGVPGMVPGCRPVGRGW
jgi:hypothetical protein